MESRSGWKITPMHAEGESINLNTFLQFSSARFVSIYLDREFEIYS